MTIAGGIAGALLKRERTGEPSVVDVSLLATGVWALGQGIGLSLQSGVALRSARARRPRRRREPARRQLSHERRPLRRVRDAAGLRLLAGFLRSHRAERARARPALRQRRESREERARCGRDHPRGDRNEDARGVDAALPDAARPVGARAEHARSRGRPAGARDGLHRADRDRRRHPVRARREPGAVRRASPRRPRAPRSSTSTATRSCRSSAWTGTRSSSCAPPERSPNDSAATRTLGSRWEGFYRVASVSPLGPASARLSAVPAGSCRGSALLRLRRGVPPRAARVAGRRGARARAGAERERRTGRRAARTTPPGSASCTTRATRASTGRRSTAAATHRSPSSSSTTRRSRARTRRTSA